MIELGKILLIAVVAFVGLTWLIVFGLLFFEIWRTLIEDVNHWWRGHD